MGPADAQLSIDVLVCCAQTGPAENPWLSAISSHFAYWASLDTALFVLRALHGLDVRQGIHKDAAASALSPQGSPGGAQNGSAAAPRAL
jgi:hypothetical protein